MAHDRTAYFSRNCDIYSYTIPDDKWAKLREYKYYNFAMVIVSGNLFAVGGKCSCSVNSTTTTRAVQCVTNLFKKLPPMLESRERPVVVATTSHLVVAGECDHYLSVEVLDRDTLQWSYASSPRKVPISSSLSNVILNSMMLCHGVLYLSQNNVVSSCSVEELIKSCKSASVNGSDDSGSVWTRLCDIPVPFRTTLATLRGQVLSVGGSFDSFGDNPSRDIFSYDPWTNSWSSVGEIPTPRPAALVAILPSNELMVVGGYEGETENALECNITEVAKTAF